MNAHKRLKIIAGLSLYAGSLAVLAVVGPDASGNSKANNSLGKKWSNTVSSNDAVKAEQDKHVINISSRQLNDCNVNAGIVQPRQKTVKEIMVTSKEVI